MVGATSCIPKFLVPVKLAINAILVKTIIGIILPTWMVLVLYLVAGTLLVCKTKLMLPGTVPNTHTWYHKAQARDHLGFDKVIGPYLLLLPGTIWYEGGSKQPLLVVLHSTSPCFIGSVSLLLSAMQDVFPRETQADCWFCILLQTLGGITTPGGGPGPPGGTPRGEVVEIPGGIFIMTAIGIVISQSNTFFSFPLLLHRLIVCYIFY